MDLQLAGKRALITGGASGLGRELVRALATEGVDVCFDYRSRAGDASALVAEVEGMGRRAVAVQGDLAERDAPDALVAAAVSALGGLDILINNAGVWLTAHIGEIEQDVWERTLAVNLRAPVWLCQAFVRQCRNEGRGGTILNVNSQGAFLGASQGHSAYAAAKAGLVAFQSSFVKELAGSGININGLAVGIMDTPMVADALAEKGDMYRARVPSGRVAEPAEIAAIGTFLVSPRAAYMTGATVDVTGGMLLR